MAKVGLDYGHGYNDSGAVGNGMYEKTVNYNVGIKVRSHLERCGISVVESRVGDSNPSLRLRTDKFNAEKVDCTISIHCNASNGKGKGVETYCYKKGGNGEKLSKAIHNEIISAKLYTSNRGVKEGNFALVRDTSAPSSLVEMAFIDNSEDAILLRDKQNEFAEAIAKGICKYLGVVYKPEVINTPSTPSTSNNKFYRVCVASYTDKSNADKMVTELKTKGYNAFIAIYDK